MVELMASSLGRLIDKSNKMPLPSEVYPGLIEPENSEPLQQNWENTKSFLTQYAIANNAKYSEE
jgi:hypothetical protein